MLIVAKTRTRNVTSKTSEKFDIKIFSNKFAHFDSNPKYLNRTYATVNSIIEENKWKQNVPVLVYKHGFRNGTGEAYINCIS